MTCKDCIHYDACVETAKNLGFAMIPNPNVNKPICKHFKDKSNIVELPCKIGDVTIDRVNGDLTISQKMSDEFIHFVDTL